MKDYTDVVVILDRSGSMESVKHDMEGGFAQFLRELRKLPGDCRMTLIQFDTESIDTVYTAIPLPAVEPLVLVPRGSTPLLDAMGTAIVQTGERLKALAEAERPQRVQVLILTDGQENSSREYTKAQVKEMVERQQSVYKWAFVYLGANVDAFAESSGMGILAGSAAPFAATPTGVREAFVAASSLVGRYHGGGAAEFSEAEREALKKK